MRDPINTLRQFEEIQNSIDMQFRAYRVLKRVKLPESVRKRLELRRAKGMYAVNFVSRISFAKFLIQEFEKRIQNQEIENLYFVTLVSDRHAAAVDDQETYDLENHKAWIAETLKGFDYFGIVEPALYPRVAFKQDATKAWVSWHVHVLIWNAATADVQKLKSAVDKEEDTFKPGGQAVKFRTVRPERLEADLLYICKSCRSEYNVYAKMDEEIDPETGEIIEYVGNQWRQNKRAIRMGQFTITVMAIGSRRLREFCVYGGEGMALMRPAMTAAKEELLAEEIARREWRRCRAKRSNLDNL